jgi:hypothetical protein
MTSITQPPLSCYHGRNRVLLVLAPAADSPCVARQRAALANEQAGLRERDVVVIWAIGRTVTVEGGERLALDSRSLASAYGVKPGEAFQTLLIGKDGGIKLRSGEPVAAARLFDEIDGMPMRQREMRAQA